VEDCLQDHALHVPDVPMACIVVDAVELQKVSAPSVCHVQLASSEKDALDRDQEVVNPVPQQMHMP
jgi:hypothetical protein